MSKVLYVGDVHARPEDLEDCQRLIRLVHDTAVSHGVDRIVFLGDQHHTMAVLRVEVVGFWRENLARLAQDFPVVLILGNHDMSGDASQKSHALMAYQDMDNVLVVDKPKVIDEILHLPYYHDPVDFVENCVNWGCETVVCHQTFQGANYGAFFAKDGVDQKLIPQSMVISGHIHRWQVFGKVNYWGGPRWLTVDDANTEKCISVVNGDVVKLISTEDACRRIVKLVDTESEPASTVFNAKDRYYVDIVGTRDWIEARRPLFTGHARVVTRRTDKSTAKVRESEGIELSLKKYMASFKPGQGTPAEVLERLVNVRIFS